MAVLLLLIADRAVATIVLPSNPEQQQDFEWAYHGGSDDMVMPSKKGISNALNIVNKIVRVLETYTSPVQ